MEDQNSQFKEIYEKSPIGILFYDKEGKLSDTDQLTLEIGGIHIG